MIEHKNSSHPLTISTGGSAPSPSSVSASSTVRLASRKAVKHPFVHFVVFACCIALGYHMTAD